MEFRAVKQQLLLLGHSWVSWPVQQLKHACPYCHGYAHDDALTHSCMCVVMCMSVCGGEDWEIGRSVMIIVRATGVPIVNTILTTNGISLAMIGCIKQMVCSLLKLQKKVLYKKSDARSVVNVDTSDARSVLNANLLMQAAMVIEN